MWSKAVLVMIASAIRIFFWVSGAFGFSPVSITASRRAASLVPRAAPLPRRSFAVSLYARRDEDYFDDVDDENDDDDDDDDDVLSSDDDDDWRAFRAKLVMREGNSSSSSSSSNTMNEGGLLDEEGDLDGIGAVFQSTAATTQQQQQQSSSSSDDTASTRLKSMTPLNPSAWAYDSGNVIEQGAVILGGVEQDYGFGLRQQYFHKAAILVLDHDEHTFTKGIILNRPTDLTLEDDVNEGVQWRVWFGGDVQNLNSYSPDIICLHSLKNKQATKASISIMKDIQWTTFENAKKLVKVGAAKPTDFWVFCGYAGWGPGQLMGELERKSWYMVATDSQTLLKELARLGTGADPRDAGLDTWDLLMRMIGRGETADEYSGDFDDLVLKEWARQNLLSAEAGGGGGMKIHSSLDGGDILQGKAVENFLGRIKGAIGPGVDSKVKEGSVLRASSADRSPFLLEKQELHKSIVLVILDDENVSVGVVLNRPASKGLDMKITDKNTGKSRKVTIPLRYGGQYAVKGQEPLLWLHASPRLRAAGIGSQIGAGKDTVYKCTSEQVTNAIGQGMASPEDFMVVSGVSVWTKGDKGIARGLQGEVALGNFEVIADSQVQDVWNTLMKQGVLTKLNLVSSLAIAEDAWKKGARANKNGKSRSSKKENGTPISGLGEGFDEEDDSLVFKSDVKVASLSDDALRSWVATFLLGAPSLGD